MRLNRISGGLLAVLLGSGTAVAQPVEPSVTTATYDAWTVRCASVVPNEGAVNPGKLCELVQTAKLRQTGQTILETALGKLDDDEPFRLVFKVPNAVFLRDPLTLLVDGEGDDALTLGASYARCNAQACIADLEIGDDALDRLLTATSVTVSFTGMSRDPIRVPVTMSGLASAFAATFAPNG